jgi:hypothetical protein
LDPGGIVKLKKVALGVVVRALNAAANANDTAGSVNANQHSKAWLSLNKHPAAWVSLNKPPGKVPLKATRPTPKT